MEAIVNVRTKELEKLCEYAMRPDFERMRMWQWGQGIAIYSLEKAYLKTKNKQYIEFIDQWITNHLENEKPGFSVNTTAPLHGILALYEINNDTRYLSLCDEFAKYLVTENPRCEKGGLEHTCTANRIDNEMWIDTVMVAGAFLVRYGLFKNERMYVNEGLRQMIIHYDFLHDEETDLIFHGYSSNDRQTHGSLWGRGNCWFAAACGIVLSMIDDTYPLKKELEDRYKRHLKAILKYQREDGSWGTVIPDLTSYSESSATAGMVIGIAKAIELGYLGDEYIDNRDKAYDYLAKHIDDEGAMTGGSYGTCVMPTDEDYKRIIQCNSEFTQGLSILAFSL